MRYYLAEKIEDGGSNVIGRIVTSIKSLHMVIQISLFAPLQ